MANQEDVVRLIRFRVGGGAPRVGVLDDVTVTEFAAVDTLADLLALPIAAIREACANPGGAVFAGNEAQLLAPVDGRTEVWAAGVTYERSRTARMAESEQSADIYDRVYAAERPELFFKSAAWRVSGPGQPVSVRADSTIDVPEPELAVVLNAEGAVAGYTICNDMSSRSIEGENPLYLPQAKIYLGGCAVGPWIVPAWEVPDPYALTIELTIARDGAAAWEGSASTAALHRKFHELAAYLFRADDFPAGVILSTGTSVVPDLPFTLEGGDEVHIRISGIGHLINPVVRGKPAVSLRPTAKCGRCVKHVGCRIKDVGCRIFAGEAAVAITAMAMQTGGPPTDAGWAGAASETEVVYLGVGAPGQPPSPGHRGNRRGSRRQQVSLLWAAAAAVVLLLVGGGATYLVTSGPAQGKTTGPSASPADAASLGQAAASAGVISPAASRSASPSSSAHASTASGQPTATSGATHTQAPPGATQRPSTPAPTHTAAPPNPPEPTGPNLVGDGDFTGSISDWNNYVTGTVIVSGGADGGDAAQMTGPSVGVSQIVSGLKPGQSYELTGWAMSKDGGRTYIGAKNYDDTGDHSSATTNSSWSELPRTFTEGAGHTTVEIYCWEADPGVGYCSNISLRALD